MKKTYLGDNVYAEIIDMQLILTTENGLPTDPSNRIVLEKEVIRALVNYLELKTVYQPIRPTRFRPTR